MRLVLRKADAGQAMLSSRTVQDFLRAQDHVMCVMCVSCAAMTVNATQTEMNCLLLPFLC